MTAGPFRQANSWRVKGGNASFAYTLDEPAQQRVALRLQLGTTKLLCADAPPKASGHPPSTAKYDKVDYFKAASKAPAPAACPQLPIAGSPSGAFVE